MNKVIDFSKYSSIKIGPKICVFEINFIDHYDEYYIIGRANNLLVSPTPPKLAVLGKTFDYIHLKGNMLRVGAAVNSGRLLSFCKKHNIKGFEILTKLPGTIGGLVKMNAGLKGDEIGRYLRAIVTHGGEIPKEMLSIGYRRTNINTVVFEAIFEVEFGFDASRIGHYQQLRSNQPWEPSAGSCFKNPQGDYAGRLIESVGLKGHKRGGAAFSPKHANFLVNLEEASFDDAFSLIDLAKKRVYEENGLTLETEVIIV